MSYSGTYSNVAQQRPSTFVKYTQQRKSGPYYCTKYNVHWMLFSMKMYCSVVYSDNRNGFLAMKGKLDV